MANYRIVINKKDEYSAVIYSISYDNPIYNLKDISQDLSRYLDEPCYILFDLLLSNGQNFNRFVKGYFNKIEIEYDSLTVVNISDDSELKEINNFYKNNRGILNDGILVPSERLMYAKL